MTEEKLPIGRVAFARAICIEWVQEHSKLVLMAFAILIVLLFCLFQIGQRFSSSKRSDFLDAQAAYSAWVSAGVADGELFKKLERPLNRHPELQAKFGALIAQHWMGLNDPKHSENYAKAALKRTKGILLPYYSDFSQNSLLITQGKIAEALTAAKGMKRQMDADHAFWASRDKMIRSGHLLYAYNLLRIATLEREMGSKDGELVAWGEFLKNSGWETTGEAAASQSHDPEAYAMLAQAFQDGEVSLIDFIRERQKELTKSTP